MVKNLHLPRGRPAASAARLSNFTMSVSEVPKAWWPHVPAEKHEPENSLLAFLVMEAKKTVFLFLLCVFFNLSLVILCDFMISTPGVHFIALRVFFMGTPAVYGTPTSLAQPATENFMPCLDKALASLTASS